MNKSTIIVFLALCILYSVLIAIHLNKGERKGDIPQNFPDPLIHRFADIMYLFAVLLIAYGVDIILTLLKIPTPNGVFTILLAYIWGMLAYYYTFPYLGSNIVQISTLEMFYLYLPILIFHRSFCLDVHIFIKTLPQILIIGVPVTILTGCVFGLLLVIMIAPETASIGAIFVGLLCMPLNPATMVDLLKQQSMRTKHISVLLEGEAVVCLLVIDLTHQLVIAASDKLMVHWYQFVMVLLRIFVLGILTGYLAGVLGRCLIRRMYTDRMSVILMLSALPFFTYSVSHVYFSGCGSVSVITLGIMMGLERTALTKNIDSFLTNYWEFVAYVMDTVIIAISATYAGCYVIPHMNWEAFVLIIVAYVVNYVLRFVSFLLFSPLISRLGYGMGLKAMVVCVWGGIKSPFSYLVVFNFVKRHIFETHGENLFFFYIFGLSIVSMLINGTFCETILKFLGFTNISMARQVNMNNCMKHIFTKKGRIIAILKMDRLLADTNWHVVYEATNMQHPYHLGLDKEEEDPFFLGYRFTMCPDCNKDLVQEPTPKELKEMTKEAKMRILKAKKMSFSRQFENGMITKHAIRVLNQAVELAMDSEDAVMEIDSIEKRFVEENYFYRFFRSRLECMQNKRTLPQRPPITYWRRLCYHIVMSTVLDKVMLLVILVHAGFLITLFYFQSGLFSEKSRVYNKNVFIAFVVLNCLFTLIYILEFVIKILAFSWIYIWAHGVRSYFKSVWNIIDFLAIILNFFNIGLDVHILLLEFGHTEETSIFGQVIDVLMILRFVRLLRVFEIFYENFTNCLARGADRKMSFTYELGKSFATSEGEILDMLPYIIDNKKIREEIKAKIENDKIVITKLLGVVQKERPWVAITVKTKQAIRTVLSSMNDAINQLKIAGWVDNYEREKLEFAMAELYKKVNAIKMVQPSPPQVIFKEVSWMPIETEVIDYLFDNVTVKKFEPGETVFGEGTVADGIYIVVTGLLMIRYVPQVNVLSNLRSFGILPIVDYLPGTKYEEPSIDYIVSGNCVGELSTLTERAYNCTITAESHSQVYVLTKSIIKQAMQLSPDPVKGLECRIWKEISVRIAFPLLLSVPAYQAFSQEQIKYAFERAFVPNLSNFKIFAVTDIIQDIILIDGVAADFNTRERFVAPCCIPRTVQKLILPSSSLMNLPIETKFLVIPEKDVNEYDVMVLAEETGEMVDTGSSQKCLLHAARQRMRNRRKLKGRISSQRKIRLDDVSSAGTDTTSQVDKESGDLVYKSTSNYGGSSMVLMRPLGGDDEDEDEDTQEFFNTQAGRKRRQTLSYFE
ncbi:Sodium/hydrogen exchanger 10-like Protein [Tribolium castaneum]|uniref:Sodium/hydrogen exchanger 10-like Protein n=2 Tax=Tribolium castaneum TaxID=7070 RepID=D6WPI0_TRICA|nr:Sodium/hydrogen exchanger 10-like Protein [Tribolium castaneum]